MAQRLGLGRCQKKVEDWVHFFFVDESAVKEGNNMAPV